MGSVGIPIEALLWVIAFALQITGTVVAIGMWSSKLTVRVEALEKKAEEHSGLALAVERLETTMKRAVSDIEGILERVGAVANGHAPALSPFAGIPPEVLARVYVEMAKGK